MEDGAAARGLCAGAYDPAATARAKVKASNPSPPGSREHKRRRGKGSLEGSDDDDDDDVDDHNDLDLDSSPPAIPPSSRAPTPSAEDMQEEEDGEAADMTDDVILHEPQSEELPSADAEEQHRGNDNDNESARENTGLLGASDAGPAGPCDEDDNNDDDDDDDDEIDGGLDDPVIEKAAVGPALAGSQDVAPHQHLAVLSRRLPLTPTKKALPLTLRAPHQRCGESACGCFVAKYDSDCPKCPTRCRLGDCIVKQGQKWAHVRCPTDATRGAPSIFGGFVTIDTARAIGEAPSQRAITFSVVDNDDPVDPVPAADIAADADHDAHNDDDEKDVPGSSGGSSGAGGGGAGGGGAGGGGQGAPAAATSNAGPSDVTMPHTRRVYSSGDVEHRQFDDERLTEEQRCLINAPSSPGEITRVGALAGSGKTTTMALKANHEIARAGSSRKMRVGYFVCVERFTHCMHPSDVLWVSPSFISHILQHNNQ
jgi:hypothetical protein